MLMSLGLFGFSIGTLAYQELRRKSDWRHARTPRIGARDASQYLGPGVEELSLSGIAYAELANGRASLDDLRAMAADGEAWPLVDGAGIVHGAFVIVAIDERQASFFPDGSPRAIEFGIDLVGVDPPAVSPTP